MTYELSPELAAMPDRLAALLRGEPDGDIDADLREAEEETGLHRGVTGTELAKKRFYYRIDLLMHRLERVVDQGYADSATDEVRQVALEIA